jgi:hypothetical protein
MEATVDTDKDIHIPYRLLAFSILLFLELGILFGVLSLLKVGLPLIWWILLFVVVTAILFGSNWYLMIVSRGTLYRNTTTSL